MSRPLAGQVAVVTGARKGVGKGCALELGAAGATVYATSRHTGSTAEEIAALGGVGVDVACDHRDDAAVEALFERVDREHGRIDVLVNSAFRVPPQLTSGRRFWEQPISDWDDMFGVGTRGAYVASALAARRMVAAGRGLIANVSSSGAAEYAWHVAYGVGKCALDRLTADAAHELRAHGVAVVSLWPGLVLTERIERNRDQLPDLDVGGAESQRFTGRAVVALACDPEVLGRSGRAWASRDLADVYGFVDLDGSLPKGPLHDRGRPSPADAR